MMETNTNGKGNGHHTMMCGDPKAWFPMRVTQEGGGGARGHRWIS